jgi:hypothetical protein
MAEQSRRGSRGSGRPVRSPSPSAAPDASTTSDAVRPSQRPAPATRRLPAPSRTLLTGPTYRRLLQGGLNPTEAANLTAFLCGLPLGPTAWRLGEINRLLFLRELHREGRFTGDRRRT